MKDREPALIVSGLDRGTWARALLAVTTALTMSSGHAVFAQEPGTAPIFELPSYGAEQGAPDREETATPADPNDGKVVGGTPTTHAAWPSLVVVHFSENGDRYSCAGTVIAPDWVLTAGHCAGGSDYTVTEEIDNLQSNNGRNIGVSQIIRNERYSVVPTLRVGRVPHNDIALLHLSSQARSPAQILSSGASGTLVAAGSASWIAGFGVTKPWDGGPNVGPGSNQLMQAGLPVVDRASCTRILGPYIGDATSSVLDEATVCAGDPKVAKDSCKGDSGGPLAVKTRGGQQVQIGVVSWGAGCAQRNTVGVYTSVGNFEGWIKQHVPSAKFYAASAQPGPVQNPNPPKPGPSPTSDPIAAIESAALAIGNRAGIGVDLIEGNRARVGSVIHFHITSPIAGQLIVYNIDLASRKAYQVFPNNYTGGNAPGITKLQIAAGASVTVPNAADGFQIRVKEPVGKNRLYAFVLPSNIRLNDIADEGMDMQDLTDPKGIFSALEDRGVEVVPVGRPDRGVAMYEYEIVR